VTTTSHLTTSDTSSPTTRSAPDATASRSGLADPAFQAFWLLRIGFTVAPILFGLDKFFHVLVDWDVYLAPEFTDLLNAEAHSLMYVVGAVEIAAGVLVFLWPRIGGYVVAAWLAGIIVNLLMIGDYYDIALRDFGLLIGAVALARLAAAFPTGLGVSRANAGV